MIMRHGWKRNGNLLVVAKKRPIFFFTLTEKNTDKSVDVPGGFVGVTIRTENN